MTRNQSIFHVRGHEQVASTDFPFFVLWLSSLTRGSLRQENVSPSQISKLNFDNREAATQKNIIIK